MVKDGKYLCPVCGGTGQVSFFQGVSRFLLTSEECPECAGTGYKQEDTGGPAVASDRAGKKKGGRNR